MWVIINNSTRSVHYIHRLIFTHGQQEVGMDEERSSLSLLSLAPNREENPKRRERPEEENQP